MALKLLTDHNHPFVYCSPKTIKCTQKPKIEKKFTGIERASERANAIPPHRIYNSLLRMRAIHVLKKKTVVVIMYLEIIILDEFGSACGR